MQSKKERKRSKDPDDDEHLKCSKPKKNERTTGRMIMDQKPTQKTRTTDCPISFTLIILSSTHDKCTLPSWDTRVKCSESPISNKGLVSNKVSVEEDEVLTKPELWITRLIGEYLSLTLKGNRRTERRRMPIKPSQGRTRP